jgi:pyruvate dehydrogenase (quinone)
MGQLVADFILERLRAWDVHRIYGYPGEGSTRCSARSTAPAATRS